MLRVQIVAKEGRLRPHARWLTRTKMMYLKKKGSVKPRPVRIGEFLRAATAKKVQRRAAPSLRKVFMRLWHWGIEMSGGAEALVHWRGLIEELALAGAIEPLVAFDLDSANMFGSVKWPQIRDAIAKYVPEASAWVKWEHADVEEIELPSGGVAYGDRGDGQGDVFGPTKSSLASGEAVLNARENLATEMNRRSVGACDEWFIDDGQKLVKPHIATE